MAEKTIKQKLDEAKKKAEGAGLLPFLKGDKELEDMLFGGGAKMPAKKAKEKQKMQQQKSAM